ncbi:MAG: polyribonucleotide nucleotidyltransferase [Patescibacteria group bacterium]|nr:polyribonucleotide nucleotidyltransferase [Patescibacteria group bacterium]
MEAKNFQTQWGGKTLSVEVGKLAQQANASCVVRYGDTVVLAAATQAHNARTGIDFFPLSVEYEEKMYAAGKIKSSRFIKREGRPTDEAVMTGRMIDRALRPIFPHGMRHEVQVVIECLCVDLENDSDIPGLVAASCALNMSDIPWNGPIAAIRVGRVNGEFVVNPTFEQRTQSDLDVIVAGTADKAIMIEANGKEIPEAVMYEAIMFGEKNLQPVIDLINQVRAAVGKPKADAEKLKGEDPNMTDELRREIADLQAKAKAFLDQGFKAALFTGAKVGKLERYAALDKLQEEMKKYLKTLTDDEDKVAKAASIFDEYCDRAVSLAILDRDERCDGRSLTDIRPLSAEVGLLPRTHGTGLFYRGETQVLSIVTLGGPGDAQILDGMDDVGKKRYMHHYNFPPYAVAETGRIGSTGRREIGHGGLAERALIPVLPEKEAFPYTIRVVSEVLGSNGSSSQGSICGSTLALMDAGVPIKRPVAGIAMGIATDEATNRWKVLTDLQDLEDGEGGMDFKIGGTANGITTIQLDTKTTGLNAEIVKQTLEQGRDARLKILDVMASAIAAPRPDLSPYAPRIETIKIDPEKIRDLIGPGGKMINKIIDETGATIDVEQDGTVTVCSVNKAMLDKAVKWVNDITREVQAGELFESGKVTRILDFGAFVEFLPNQEGMVHISELAPWRVNKVTDVVNVGDVVPVKVIKIDELGRINLSLKAAKEALGQEQKMPEGYEPDSGGRGFGGGDRGGFGRGGDRGGRGGGGFRRDDRPRH